MKYLKLAGITALLLFAQSSPAQIISGTLSNVSSDSLVLRWYNSNTPMDEIIDTIAIDNKGHFTYDKKIDKTTEVYIASLNELRNSKRPKYISTFAVPGERLVLSGSFDKYEIGGSKFFQEYKKIKAPITEIDNKVQAVYDESNQLPKDNDSIMTIRKSKLDVLFNQRKEYIIKYVKSNPDSDLAAALIGAMATKHTEEAVALLTPRARHGICAPLFEYKLEMIKQRNDKEKRLSDMEGKPAPDFTLPGLDGKPVSLSDFRGKYVIVDFWGSWCGWCIKGIPGMKAAYNKHKGKFEVISIDCRDTEAKWKEAVAKYEMPWVQVRCDNNCNISDTYNVLGYPTYVAIDPKGVILKIFTGESPEMYNLLDTKLGTDK